MLVCAYATNFCMELGKIAKIYEGFAYLHIINFKVTVLTSGRTYGEAHASKSMQARTQAHMYVHTYVCS